MYTVHCTPVIESQTICDGSLSTKVTKVYFLLELRLEILVLMPPQGCTVEKFLPLHVTGRIYIIGPSTVALQKFGNF